MWAVPGENAIIDEIDPATGLTRVYQRDEASVKAERPAAVRMTWDEWRTAAAARQQTPVSWREINGRRYREISVEHGCRCADKDPNVATRLSRRPRHLFLQQIRGTRRRLGIGHIQHDGNATGRVIQDLRRLVTDATPGTRLPSVRELTARHRASPVTVAAAVRHLVAQGLVETRSGRGTFVTETPVLRYEFGTPLLFTYV